MDPENYKDKKVIITGAAGIFGAWIAKAFARKGASICLSDINETKLRELSMSTEFETNILLHQTDLSNPKSIEELVDFIKEKWGYVDILINNAGIYTNHMLLEMKHEDWKRVLGINLTAPFLLTQKLTKLMVEKDIKGVIVNITSGAAYTVRSGSGHYSTSKAGLAMLTRAFALELAPYQIRVNSVGPGFAPGSDTNENQLDAGYIQSTLSKIPLGRTSKERDTAEAILFLCSERASFITGAYLPVDGGKSAGNFTTPRSFVSEVAQ